MNYWAELRSILDTMEVPQYRKVDLKWLSQNLGTNIRNLTHKDFNRAMEIIRYLLKEQGQ